ncbi:MAG TPA: hypothetical protein VEA38_13555 [Terriglobales bacterium]|nr:hypothetical protein [Terriglobales bacterium]
MSVVVDRDGRGLRTKGILPRIERLSAEDVQDPARLSRTLNAIAESLDKASALLPPEYIEFEDFAVAAGTNYQLRHGFGGRVRAWVAAGSTVTLTEVSSLTDANHYGFAASGTATLTIRITPRGA